MKLFFFTFEHTVSKKKRDQNVFYNISYKTGAIPMKFANSVHRFLNKYASKIKIM